MRITGDFNKVIGLLRDGHEGEVNEFIRQNWLGRLHANYEPIGDLFFKTDQSEACVTNYRRSLDITNSILEISYS